MAYIMPVFRVEKAMVPTGAHVVPTKIGHHRCNALKVVPTGWVYISKIYTPWAPQEHGGQMPSESEVK